MPALLQHSYIQLVLCTAMSTSVHLESKRMTLKRGCKNIQPKCKVVKLINISCSENSNSNKREQN